VKIQVLAELSVAFSVPLKGVDLRPVNPTSLSQGKRALLMQELLAKAKFQGLPEKLASQVLRVSPRTLKRWQQPAQPKALAVPR